MKKEFTTTVYFSLKEKIRIDFFKNFYKRIQSEKLLYVSSRCSISLKSSLFLNTLYFEFDKVILS